MMSFADRLWKIRDEAGISQERLAEELGISRQAVAKWETGTAMPDIDNLVGISNFFQVSIDYLIKDANCHGAKCISNYDSSEIIDFIVEAKKNIYSSTENFNAARLESSRMGSKDLAYGVGDFKYWDSYVGSASFSGSEVVYHREMPVWSMNYIGRSLLEETNATFNFLTDALSLVTIEIPYRGPAFYRDGKYTYMNSVSGEFEWFQGVEKIYYEDELVYELFYHGGEVK